MCKWKSQSCIFIKEDKDAKGFTKRIYLFVSNMHGNVTESTMLELGFSTSKQEKNFLCKKLYKKS